MFIILSRIVNVEQNNLLTGSKHAIIILSVVIQTNIQTKEPKIWLPLAHGGPCWLVDLGACFLLACLERCEEEVEKSLFLLKLCHKGF